MEPGDYNGILNPATGQKSQNTTILGISQCNQC
jgi:hypothetical protein